MASIQSAFPPAFRHLLSDICSLTSDIRHLTSDQILLADGRAEAVVVDHELADELVQAALEYIVHAAVLEPGADLASEPLRYALAAVGARDVVEILHQILVTACERARHLVVENEQVGD